MKACTAYWIHGRTFVPVVLGHKKITGLVIEADGFHKHEEPAGVDLSPVEYRGDPYPTHKLLAFLRARRGATDGAEALRKRAIKEIS